MKTKPKRQARPKLRTRPRKKKLQPVNPPGAMVAYKAGRQIHLDRQQVDLIRRLCAKDANNDEFAVFMQIAKSSRLDPFKKQIYCLVFNKDKDRQMVIIVGIDGYRTMAARDHADYIGASNVHFEFGDRKTPSGKKIPEICTLEILSKNSPPLIVTRYWDEVAPHDLNEKRASFWRNSPCDMLEKCTEGKGVRKRFPGLGNMYVDAELDRARMEQTPGGRPYSIDGRRPDGSLTPEGQARQLQDPTVKKLQSDGRWCEKHQCHIMKCPVDEHTPAENDAAFKAQQDYLKSRTIDVRASNKQQTPKETHKQPVSKPGKVASVRTPAPSTHKPATEKPKKTPEEQGGELFTGTIHNITHAMTPANVPYLTVQINRVYWKCWRRSIFDFLGQKAITNVIECWVKDGAITGLKRLGDDHFEMDGKTRIPT